MNADYASKATDRRSVSGGAIMCSGACVCWFCKTQRCLTLSTSEAERATFRDAVKMLLVLRQVWRFIFSGKSMPYFEMFKDNHNAVQLAQTPVTNTSSKNNGVRHHFLRELVHQGDISVTYYVPCEYRHVDVLTKAL